MGFHFENSAHEDSGEYCMALLGDYVGCSMLSMMLNDDHNDECCILLLGDCVGCCMLSVMFNDDHKVVRYI